MAFQDYFTIWDKLTADQQRWVSDSIQHRTIKKGTVVHNGSLDCAGLLLIESGQLRAYMLSDEGREITLYRLFDMDICLFSASCIMRSVDCAGLLLIESGQLRAYMLSDEGREITLYRLFDMDICLFSASCIMRSVQFEIIIQAEKDTQLWVIPPQVYKKLMEESAPVANYTNELMASRFSEVMWLVEQIMWKSLDKRLAAFLLEESAIEGTPTLKLTHEMIANHLFSEVMWLVEQIMWKSLDKRLAAFLLEESAIEGTPTLKLTHEMIANHLGSHREVITRMLRYFQSEGMVRLSRGTVTLTDEDKLQALSNNT